MKLADYLAHFKITQQAFATTIGVTQASVGRYAAHNRMPRPKIMRKIAEATDRCVTADDFMADPPPPRRRRRASIPANNAGPII